MREIIDNLILKDRRTKGELIDFLGLSNGGFYNKMAKGTWKKKDLELLSDFFSVPIEIFTGDESDNSTKSDKYLQDYLLKIENEWKSIVAEKDNIIAEYKDIIKDLKQSRAAGQSNFLKPAPKKTYWLDSKQIKRLPVAGAVAGRRA